MHTTPTMNPVDGVLSKAKWLTGFILLSLGLGAQTFAASPDDEVIEEVVVTGSYLKRTAADSPSPLSVIGAAQIEDLGAADVAEVIASLPWQSGSQTRASTFQGEGADGRNSINLRNLGHGATLPLVNGKRQVPSWYNDRGNASVNVNALVPNIAIERIEIVRDGASSLYGSDAIAGVINFITKRDFEGFDIQYQFSTDEETGKGDANNLGVIWGVRADRGGIVAATSFLNRDEIDVDDRYERFGGSTASGTGQPGRIVPRGTVVWADHGLRPGEVVGSVDGEGAFPRDALGLSYGQADVNCEDAAALEEGGALGPVFGNNICAYDFGSFFALQAEESLRNTHVTGDYDVTDTLEIYFEFANTTSRFDRLNSLNPNAPILTIGVDHFGNIEDAFRRGIEVIPVGNQTRLIGGTRNTSSDRRPLDTFTKTARSVERAVIGGIWDTELAGRAWTIDVSYTASEHDSATTQVQDTLSAQMELAIAGLGGPNCDIVNGTPGDGNQRYADSGGVFFDPTGGNCYYFNPFGNARFDRDGNEQTDLTLVNPAELYEYLAGRVTSDTEFTQRVIDVVATGDLFDLSAGAVALAVGFQRRVDSGAAVFDAATNSNNLDFAFGIQDWSGTVTTNAAFAEIGIPLTESLEANLAVRYEDFDELSENTTDPKLSVLWRPTDDLSLRGSVGTSFRVPTIQQLFGNITTVHNMADTGLGGTAFRPSITVGNPDLKPEESTNFNIGVSWSPTSGGLEGFQIDLDYYNYEYEDIITREGHVNLLREDLDALNAYASENNTSLLEAVEAGAGNRDQIIRNSTGGLLRVLPNLANANGADVSGLDLSSSYQFDTDIGSWRLGFQAAYLMEYEVEVANRTDGGVSVFDAVGEYNDDNPVARPLPEWKANGTVNWSLDKHRAFFIVKYVDGVNHNFTNGSTFFAETARLAHGDAFRDKFLDSSVDSWITADLNYTYSMGELKFINDASITLGIQNITDEEPPFVPVITGYDGTLHDPRGRVWLLRVNASM